MLAIARELRCAPGIGRQGTELVLDIQLVVNALLLTLPARFFREGLSDAFYRLSIAHLMFSFPMQLGEGIQQTPIHAYDNPSPQVQNKTFP